MDELWNQLKIQEILISWSSLWRRSTFWRRWIMRIITAQVLRRRDSRGDKPRKLQTPWRFSRIEARIITAKKRPLSLSKDGLEKDSSAAEDRKWISPQLTGLMTTWIIIVWATEEIKRWLLLQIRINKLSTTAPISFNSQKWNPAPRIKSDQSKTFEFSKIFEIGLIN